MGTLLMEFFELYGKHYNYDEVGISIRRGGFYYSKRSRGWYRGGQAYLLSVEDPQDPGERLSLPSKGGVADCR
jgi:non-canonical poly(A) RNA polymerase PAPD5/7